jgi:hypothetical protein
MKNIRNTIWMTVYGKSQKILIHTDRNVYDQVGKGTWYSILPEILSSKYYIKQ